MILLVNGAGSILRWLPQDYLPHGVKGGFFGALFSPSAGNSLSPVAAAGLPWAADNEAFVGFSESKFLLMCERLEKQLDTLFIVVPDVVGDHAATLERFRHYQPILHQRFGKDFPLAFVAQDGLESDFDAGIPWGTIEAVFIGGSNAFKLGPFVRQTLAPEVKRRGLWLHMGRVNSHKRIRYAHSIGCDSIDGTSFSWFSKTHLVPALDLLYQLGESPFYHIVQHSHPHQFQKGA